LSFDKTTRRNMSAVNVAYGWTMPTPTLQHTRKVQQKSRSKMRSLDAKATATVESLFSSTSATLLEETETTVTLSKESSLLNGTTMVVYDSSVDDNMSLMGAKSTTSTNQKQTTPSSSSSPVQTVNMDLASIKTKMDATETEMAAKSSPRASSSSSMLPPSIARASQLLKITWNEFLLPVGQAIRNAATDTTSSSSSSSSWSVFSLTSDEFWQLPIMVKAEPSSPTTTTTTTTVAQQFTRLLEILGVTYVKFGQALSARPDIVPRPLAVALTKLQDQMDISQELQTRALVQRILEKEWESTTSHNNVVVLDKNEILDTLSERPEAAASIGVVYSAYYQGQKVCVKIQRPNIAQMVQQDAQLLRTAAKLLESIPPLPGSSNNNNKRFIQTDLSGAVEEFMSRIVEELDYRNEAANIELFGSLYSHRRPTLEKTTDIQVVVPKVYREMCTEKVVVMEWIDGVKLVDLQRQRQRQRQQSGDMGDDDTTRDLIQQGIDCTLSQLLDTGILHADPHGGNLLKVIDSEGDDVSNGRPAYRLGYVGK
jgi:predicted Ser/Thr protein kinase